VQLEGCRTCLDYARATVGSGDTGVALEASHDEGKRVSSSSFVAGVLGGIVVLAAAIATAWRGALAPRRLLSLCCRCRAFPPILLSRRGH
jgi:hypothetical protein